MQAAPSLPPLSPPSPERVAELDELTTALAEKQLLGRAGHAAELAGRAGDLALCMVRQRVTPLHLRYGADSLVGGKLRLCEAFEWHNQAATEGPTGPARLTSATLAWSALLAAIAVLAGRLAAGTLLPGTCREEEERFHASRQAQLLAAMRTRVGAPPSVAELRAASTAVGYFAALGAAQMALTLMTHVRWPEAERLRAKAFVFATLDAVPAAAALLRGVRTGAEARLVDFIVRRLAAGGPPGELNPAFRAAVLAIWASPAVGDVLRARGALRDGVADTRRTAEVRRLADVAARGFRTCGLLSCDKLETTVRHFKLCGGCDAVAYCCDEHHGVHWREGHRRECRHLKAAGAKAPSTADAA